MKELTAARRYAEALLEVAVERDKVQNIEEQINLLAEIYNKNQDLQQYLKNPLMGWKAKVEGIKEIFSGQFDEEIILLVVNLIKKEKASIIPRVSKMYDDLADEYFGVVKVKASTARSLDEDEQKKLKSKLENLLEGQEVEITYTVEESLLAGVKLNIGDHVLDGSLSGKMEQFEGVLFGQETIQ